MRVLFSSSCKNEKNMVKWVRSKQKPATGTGRLCMFHFGNHWDDLLAPEYDKPYYYKINL